MIELTQKEKSVYEYIKNCLENNGYAPSVRDICTAVGIRSTSSVHEYIRKLETKGYITKCSGKSRALKIESKSPSERGAMKKVPILGRVTAGVPILAVENYEGYVDFPAGMARGKANLFALRVMGESMIEAGILDGDIVVVESRKYADDGEIVVPEVLNAGVEKVSEAQNALMVLGYKQSEAAAALRGIDVSKLELEDIIREALKKLMK